MNELEPIKTLSKFMYGLEGLKQDCFFIKKELGEVSPIRLPDEMTLLMLYGNLLARWASFSLSSALPQRSSLRLGGCSFVSLDYRGVGHSA